MNLRSLSFALLGLCTLSTPPALHAQGKPRQIADDAKLFSPDAIKHTNEVIAAIKARHRKDLHIETVEKTIPADERTKWAENRFLGLGVDGVYLVIIKGDKGLAYRYVVGNRTRENGYITKDDLQAFGYILAAKLTDRPDEALLFFAQYTLTSMDRNSTDKTFAALFKNVPEDLRANVIDNPVRIDRVDDWLRAEIPNQSKVITVPMDVQEIFYPGRKDGIYSVRVRCANVKVNVLGSTWEARVTDSPFSPSHWNFSFEGVTMDEAEKFWGTKSVTVKGKVKLAYLRGGTSLNRGLTESKGPFAQPSIGIILEDVQLDGRNWAPVSPMKKKAIGQ